MSNIINECHDESVVEYSDGSKKWFINDKLHRVDGPAVEGGFSIEWYINGKLHRDDGPAVENGWGTKEWYSHGKLHRDDGPAIESWIGGREWFINGKRHREDGPAIDLPNKNGISDQHWFINGKEHRIDGPAIIRNNETKEWRLDGNKVTQIQHEKYIQLINKRERRIQFRTIRRWTDWMMDPSTERGKRFIDRQYQRMVEIN